ncbi:hypothetical protein HK44_001445 [Pseudomonas fluorescens HK44]|uniref:GIY-YIG domain-containing protein n=1 Tax=Pseudomonas fluorescens HK44 TaxID=1042209 RepID=A0A010RQC8_PSEFL|nr:hypothetical protein [Pseudomonas fluorescens]EXF94656.1 hypothetical protein HK44_001445 [Pseudomonas fluorescens HK44]
MAFMGANRYAAFAQPWTDHLEKSLNFQQAYAALESLIHSLPSLFSDVTVNFAFGENRPAIGDWLDPLNLGLLATGDGIGSKSGVYFFGSPEGEIIYIGKATKNNLHHRVWDHVKTPQVELDGRRTFPKHGFSERSYTPEQTACILGGDAFLGVVTVSDPELVSMVEVYLHTVHVKTHGCLPCLNKQIG